MIKVVKIKKNKDGSADVTLDMDKKTQDFMVQNYVLRALEDLIKKKEGEVI